MIRLLLCTRDLHLPSLLTRGLSTDFSLATDSDPERVKDLIAMRRCDLVILDFECVPDRDSFGFAEQLRQSGATLVILTGDRHSDIVELARRGFQDLLQKPPAFPELNVVIRRAWEYANLRREARNGEPGNAPGSGSGELVGSAPGSRAVYDSIRRVANLDASVLIMGESGTGKELIARAIHCSGHRQSRPFIAVSCGAIPESLIEAELFGSEKGAFTGATSRRIGYLESVGDGTLLLDEIAEIGPHTQIKLLRVLQQREFMRLGSSSPIPLRARLVFATNRNLKQMLAEKSFREDLYYRIAVVCIQPQPLRERREEIPQLAQHFLAKYARSFHKNVASITPGAALLLREHSWPGNVRELENVIQSAIINSDNESIGAADLPEELQRHDSAIEHEALRWESFENQLRDYKTRLAMEAVRECNGNKKLAAQSLNISRTYLHRLLREPADERPALRVA